MIDLNGDIDFCTDFDKDDCDVNHKMGSESNLVDCQNAFFSYFPAIQGCRCVDELLCIGKVEEGSYGVVYRARDKRTDEIVALKKLKSVNGEEGFPITALREIKTLLKVQHSNIIAIKEVVVGSNIENVFIVMDFIEHNLKSFMETMKIKKEIFISVEVKRLLKQLLCAVAYLHDNWILHRDLKPSNLLIDEKGILKVCDFGLAREYGSRIKQYTPVVTTLWYRAPELLLLAYEYSTPIDMWSVGCIFAELLFMEPLFLGESEIDQLHYIFKILGTPNELIWPGYSKLPVVQKVAFPEFQRQLHRKINLFRNVPDLAISFLNEFLIYNPDQRITSENAIRHDYFS